jgi:hypothetical protein
MSWPWPRVIPTKYHTFYVVSNRLCELSWANAGYWIVEPLIEINPLEEIAQFEIADFGLFYVVCILLKTGEPRTLAFYPNEGWIESTENICGIGCNFNGQFIGSATVTPREILWTAIGNYEFNPDVDRTAGFRQLFFPDAGRKNAKVLRILQLGKSIVVYANNGRIVMEPSTVNHTFAYGMEQMYGLGIASGNHVAGDDRVHGYIDLRNDFWTIDTAGDFTKLGYREFIGRMDNDNIVVSYYPVDRRFYICDGHECLIINSHGAYHTNQLVSSVMQKFDGLLVGTIFGKSDREARLTTEWLDFGSRGIKSVESLLISTNNAPGVSCELTVDYRMQRNEAFKRFNWITSGPTGEAGIHVAALDFRLAVKISDFRNIEIDSLMANVKYSDQRFKRGTVPEQYNAARQGL